MPNEPLVIVIHGSGGSPDINWFPWLKKKLSEKGVECLCPKFPPPESQSLESWRNTFYSEIGELKPHHILVGHSTGVALALNLLNEAKLSILATFLAAGFVGKIGHPYYDALNSSFFESSFDWKVIKKNAGTLFLYAGDDDPYVPLAKGKELSVRLESPLIVIPEGGHLNYESGFNIFEAILSDIFGCCEPLPDMQDK